MLFMLCFTFLGIFFLLLYAKYVLSHLYEI